jgi:hypothetical protein
LPTAAQQRAAAAEAQRQSDYEEKLVAFRGELEGMWCDDVDPKSMMRIGFGTNNLINVIGYVQKAPRGSLVWAGADNPVTGVVEDDQYFAGLDNDTRFRISFNGRGITTTSIDKDGNQFGQSFDYHPCPANGE